jgi:thioredoxin 1
VIRELRGHELDRIAKKEKGYYLIKFGSKTCGPCKVMEPVLESFASHNPETNIYLVDTEESPELSAHFGIRSVPTIHFCKKREIVYTLNGVKPEAELKFALDNLDDEYFKENGKFKIVIPKSQYYFYAIAAALIVLFLVLVFIL